MGKEPFFSINFHAKDMELFLAEKARQFNASRAHIVRAKITALNSVSSGWKKEGLNVVRQLLALKDTAKYYNRTVFVLKASSSQPYIVFRATGPRSLPLSNYDFLKNLKPGKKGGRPVQSRVYMDASRKALEHDNTKAFIFKAPKSGKKLIGERTAEKGENGRNKVRVLYAPSLISLFRKPSITDHLLEATFARFQKRFEHNLQALMKGYFK